MRPNRRAYDVPLVCFRMREVGQLSTHERIRESKMIDTTTHQPLHVSTDGDAGPYIMVPVAQLGAVRALLDLNKVPYSGPTH